MPIYDQTFRNYSGTRRTRRLWLPVARQTLLPILRSKLTWILLAGALIPVIVFSVGFFASAKLMTLRPEQADAAAKMAEMSEIPLFGRQINLNTLLFMFLRGEFVFLWLLVLINGGGSIITDKLHSALPLYFSRPLTPLNYLAGKVAGITALPVAVLGLASMLLFLQAAAYFFSFREAVAQLPMLGGALVFIIVCSLLVSLSMVAMSSFAKNARQAGVVYLGFWFLTGVIAQGIEHATKIDITGALAPSRSLQVIGAHLIGANVKWLTDMGRHAHGPREFTDFGMPMAWLSIALYMALFAWITWRNLKVVEVVK
ncbi:MAG: ABC transporter permease subunit [bacterium]|nr:hypothetical protein [Candidatus Sumerlaeota bacterium]